MVDAYEIGIELALQDGVSAGLEAVTREMAALDVAVASSSAGLMALIRTAGMAVEAVAAVGGIRVRAPAASEPAAARQSGEDEAVAPGERAAPTVRDEEPGSVAPVTVVRGDSGEAVGQTVAAGEAAAAPERTLVREVSREVERTPVIAPVAVVTRAGQQTEAGPREEAVVPAREGSAVPVRDMLAPMMGRQGTAAAPATAPTMMERPGTAVTPATAPTLRAEVAQALPGRRATVEADRLGGVMGRERDGFDDGQRGAAAPMGTAAGVERPRPGGSAAGADRTVAPMRMAAGPGGGGGTVLLDGRLVGEWLMDRMARDAGRPGAGTTSFDSRQGAAWTPTGVG